MSHPDGPILVMGLGNILVRDEGVGVHVVRELQRLVDHGDVELPPGTALIDGGTLGLGLLPLMSNARAVLLVDAIDGGRAPGAVEVIRAEALGNARVGGVPPDPIGVEDLLASARLTGVLPGAVALVGIQPGEVSVGLELTEAVRAMLPAAVATTLVELRRLDSIAPSSAPVRLTASSIGKGLTA